MKISQKELLSSAGVFFFLSETLFQRRGWGRFKEWKIFVSIAVFIAIAVHLTAQQRAWKSQTTSLLNNIKHKSPLKWFQTFSSYSSFLCFLWLAGKHDDLGGAHNRGNARAH